eukprot:1808798-Pleurochrysis_carterae.AAC.2
MCARGQSPRAPRIQAAGPCRRGRPPQSRQCRPVCTWAPCAGRRPGAHLCAASPRAPVPSGAPPGAEVGPRRTRRACAAPMPRPVSRSARN